MLGALLSERMGRPPDTPMGGRALLGVLGKQLDSELDSLVVEPVHGGREAPAAWFSG